MTARSRGNAAKSCLTVGVLVAGVSLTACSGSTSGDAPLPSVRPSVVGEATGSMPKLKWGLPYGEPNTIDPPNTAYYSSALVAMNLCDPLLRLNPDYSISDGLASLETPNPTTLRLTLREGVKFWDGKPLTSADVVWSLEHAQASIVGFLYRNVKSIVAVDVATVDINLTQPDALLPKELASFGAGIQQKAFSVKAGQKLGSPSTGVMCTGAFELESWKPGAGITLTANPDYWDDAHRARAKSVTLSFLTDSTALAQALTTGEIDGAYEVPASAVPALRSTSVGRLTLGSPSQQYVGLSPMRTDGPLATAELRKAFYMTINRADIARVPFHNAAEPNYTAINTDAWDNPSTGSAGRDLWSAAYKSFAQERKDWGGKAAIAEAGKLARSAGYDGAPITLAVPAGDTALGQTALLIQESAKKAGFIVKIRSLDPASYSAATTDPAARKDIDMYLNLSFNVAPDPAEAVETFMPGTYFNFIGYDNEDVTRLVKDSRSATDRVTVAKSLIAAQAEYEKNYGFQALVQLSEISFLREGLGGMTTSFAYLSGPSLAEIGPSK